MTARRDWREPARSTWRGEEATKKRPKEELFRCLVRMTPRRTRSSAPKAAPSAATAPETTAVSTAKRGRGAKKQADAEEPHVEGQAAQALPAEPAEEGPREIAHADAPAAKGKSGKKGKAVKADAQPTPAPIAPAATITSPKPATPKHKLVADDDDDDAPEEISFVTSKQKLTEAEAAKQAAIDLFVTISLVTTDIDTRLN